MTAEEESFRALIMQWLSPKLLTDAAPETEALQCKIVEFMQTVMLTQSGR